MMKKLLYTFLAILLLTPGCYREEGTGQDGSENLTILFINDPHAQLENFAKLAYIVEEEREDGNVIVACSGDMFSGNPVVDNHPQKGYPMIELMNRVGFDVSAIGNHEFDYGVSNLTDRMKQAGFQWICANVDMGSSGIPEPPEYVTLSVGDLKVTFLGLIETDGKEGDTIPSTHPWKVEDLQFQNPQDVVVQYAGLKEQEGSDLYIALTHIGQSGNDQTLGDIQLAEQFPYFDLIIGGHSHDRVDTTVNNIPVFQAGSYLHQVGKIELTVKEKKVSAVDFELIDLDTYPSTDAELTSLIEEYNDLPFLNEVIGYSGGFHPNNQVGCFYTDALRAVMGTDLAFQNTGGVRAPLDEGEITRREIFEIAPFNNGTVIYEMTVSEVIAFLKGSASGFYYSGPRIEQVGNDIALIGQNDEILDGSTMLTLGVNDYIPAVYEDYFPADGSRQSLTAAESIIYYLENINDQVIYTDCDQYFRFE